MAPLTGYPAGSPNAPQSRLGGGGALVPYVDNIKTNTTADPNVFQQLLTNTQNLLGGGLNMLQNINMPQLTEGQATLAGRAARYGPGAAVAAGQLSQGNILEGVGAGLGTALAGKLTQGLVKANPLLGGAVALGSSLVASQVGSGLGHAVSSIGGQLASGAGQLFGGAQVAAQGAVQGAANLQREGGQAAGTGAQAGVASPLAQQQAINYARQMGVNLPREYLEQNYQIMQKYKDADLSRLMQTQQQTAMLQGQLNQQIISGQLASGAQTQAGATTRDILNNNPYQQAVLNTGSTRGI
jgi:hypothetical protein